MTGLSCRALTVTVQGRDLLHGVSLSLEPGRVTVIVGPNGAGKSTLLSCLAGLRDPTSGAVGLDDTDLSEIRSKDRAQRIAYLPQIPEVAWPVEARTLIELGRVPFVGARGLTEADRMAVERAVAEAGVEAFTRRTVDTLSGGERARVLIARALAGEPAWLLADEPLAGLDPAHQLDATDLFRRLAREGMGVVVTLHDLSLAFRLADRVIVLAQGAIIADAGPVEALTPDNLRRAYGVEASLGHGPAGPFIDVLRRV